jgi:hypothetical protein
VLFQLTGDRCAQLDGMAVGDEVRIDFSLRGREWRSPSGEIKYFNSLDVWKVEPMRAGAGAGGRRGGGGGGGRQAPDDRSGPPAVDYEARPSDDRNRDLDDIPF